MSIRVFEPASLMKFLQNTRTFERCLEKLKIIAMRDGKCVAEIRVDETHTNPAGGLHGGFSATLVDCISTYALMTQNKANNVSVDINVRYLRGAKAGDDILIEANLAKKGKTLAFLDVEIKNKSDGSVLVKGTHVKFLLE